MRTRNAHPTQTPAGGALRRGRSEGEARGREAGSRAARRGRGWRPRTIEGARTDLARETPEGSGWLFGFASHRRRSVALREHQVLRGPKDAGGLGADPR